MRIVAFLLVFWPVFAQAESCGLFQRQDYGDVVAYTLIDFSSQRPQTLNFTVMNRNSAVVSGMMSGLCYCVDGIVSQDPNYSTDLLYQLIEIKAVVSGPTSGCFPTSGA
jgi:hypothetical protein